MNFIHRVMDSYCPVCHSNETEKQQLLCIDCLESISLNDAHCKLCAAPLTTMNSICGECQKQPPRYDSVFAPYLYKDTLKTIISQLKSQYQLVNSRILADLFLYQLAPHAFSQQNTIIVPVPSTINRLRQRGFNPTLEIARFIAKKSGLKLAPTMIQRKGNAMSQQGLNRKQRIKNVRNAFHYRGELSYKNVIIFDDVMTSGATINTLSQTILSAGAQSVHVWVIARTPLF